MTKTLAKIISVIFHPSLVPSYLLLILFNTNTHYFILPFSIKKLMFSLIFLCSFLIPLSITPFLVHLKILSNIRILRHKECVIPLLIGALCYFFAVYILKRFNLKIFEFIEIFMLASGILIILSAVVSIKWKISTHLISLGGLMSGIFYYGVNYISDFTNVLAGISLVAGTTAFARLKLNENNSAQVYSSFLLGFVGMLLLFVII